MTDKPAETMLERAAKRLCFEASETNGKDPDREWSMRSWSYKTMARSVIEGIREPSDYLTSDPDFMGRSWSGAIRAILNEEA